MTDTSPKKILYIITKGHWGGANRYVFELAIEMRTLGHTVAVACGGSGVFTQKLAEAEIPVFSIESFERDINLKKELSSLFELAQVMRKFRPDIVHLNSSKAGGSGALIARIIGIPRIVFTAHGWPFFEPRSFLWRSLVWIFSWLTALLSHRVILVSHYDYIRTHMPFVKNKLSVIHTAMSDVTFFSREEARERLNGKGAICEDQEALWVCTIGEYVKNKNLLTAIRAVEVVNKTSPQKLFYTLIGVDGDERPQLEAYIKEHELGSYIGLLGFVDNARAYLKAYDIFILPSLKEGLPYGLIEAGAAGVPCIASNVGGLPEVITNEVTGLLINPKEVQSIVAAFKQYIESPEERSHYAHALEKKVRTEFSLETMVKETTEIYGL
jgi:glycosyltransferase involved in cell wall biosynthesis